MCPGLPFPHRQIRPRRAHVQPSPRQHRLRRRLQIPAVRVRRLLHRHRQRLLRVEVRPVIHQLQLDARAPIRRCKHLKDVVGQGQARHRGVQLEEGVRHTQRLRGQGLMRVHQLYQDPCRGHRVQGVLVPHGGHDPRTRHFVVRHLHPHARHGIRRQCRVFRRPRQRVRDRHRLVMRIRIIRRRHRHRLRRGPRRAGETQPRRGHRHRRPAPRRHGHRRGRLTLQRHRVRVPFAAPRCLGQRQAALAHAHPRRRYDQQTRAGERPAARVRPRQALHRDARRHVEPGERAVRVHSYGGIRAIEIVNEEREGYPREGGSGHRPVVGRVCSAWRSRRIGGGVAARMILRRGRGG